MSPATGRVSGRTATSEPAAAAKAAAPAAGKLGADPSEASIGQLMGEIAADLSALMRKEVELAKAEVKAEASKAGKGAGMLGGAGYSAHMVLLFGSFALWYGIANGIGLGWAALVVAVLWAVAAALLAVQGRNQLRRVHPKPERTVETLEEDLRWARHPRS
ncbi:MAG TPA: phage holin family protein [Mycobacteriales bacterium]|nr:phage holin family protein [Mycobacteriales bacterium]